MKRPPLAKLAPRLAAAQLLTAPPAPKRADPELLTTDHRAWRAAVIQRAGFRCEAVDDGMRCTQSAARGAVLYADHIKERRDGGELLALSNGQCLCASHHVKKTLQARNRRAGWG
jgi:hypothetical protein